MKKYNVRHLAVKSIFNTVSKKAAFNPNSLKLPDIELADKKLVVDLCFNLLRFYPRLEFFVEQLIQKPIKDLEIQLLLMLGLYQLECDYIPEYAAVNETVDACTFFAKPWASKLINACLRNFLRDKNNLQKLANSAEKTKYAHPGWMVEAIKTSWPKHFRDILTANNQKAPLSIRLNLQHISREKYCSLLEQAEIEYSLHEYSPYGLSVEPSTRISDLPLFKEGYIYIQDQASQLAAPLLSLKAKDKVLDACAAPGGKATHMLELEPKIKLALVDNDKRRLQMLQENLLRMKQKALVCDKDILEQIKLFQQQNIKFNKILLDAPCSSLGVIRRHPDIKLTRTKKDVAIAKQQQRTILRGLWSILEEGGTLLYTTCSILPQENEEQMDSFVKTNKNVVVSPIEASWGIPLQYGRQILPSCQEPHFDGFYYSLLQKISKN